MLGEGGTRGMRHAKNFSERFRLTLPPCDVLSVVSGRCIGNGAFFLTCSYTPGEK